MKRITYIITVLLSLILMEGCDDIEKDEEGPIIDISANDASPQNCGNVYRGESFTYKVRFIDNIELGSYSIEMHNNFDHHTHSTSVVECDLDPIKTAINPLLFIKEFQIPAGQRDYIATGSIDIPASVDRGDYHFMIRLTDKSGWQNFIGISLKIIDKK